MSAWGKSLSFHFPIFALIIYVKGNIMPSAAGVYASSKLLALLEWLQQSSRTTHKAKAVVTNQLPNAPAHQVPFSIAVSNPAINTRRLRLSVVPNDNTNGKSTRSKASPSSETIPFQSNCPSASFQSYHRMWPSIVLSHSCSSRKCDLCAKTSAVKMNFLRKWLPENWFLGKNARDFSKTWFLREKRDFCATSLAQIHTTHLTSPCW